MDKRYQAPWNFEASGAGILVKSCHEEPIVFIYGINQHSKAIAEAIVNLEFSFSHDK